MAVGRWPRRSLIGGGAVGGAAARGRTGGVLRGGRGEEREGRGARSGRAVGADWR